MSELSPKWFENIERKTGFNLALQIGKAVLLAWLPAQVIWLTVRQIYPGPSEDMIFLKTPLRAFTVLILLAPMLETYMMRFPYYILGKILKKFGLIELSQKIPLAYYQDKSFFIMPECLIGKFNAMAAPNYGQASTW